MPNIGIILAGAASKGAYEIGCLRAIEEYFGVENIRCVSSASIGTLVAQAHSRGQFKEVEELWKSIDPKEHGRFFLTYSGNEEILRIIDEFVEHSEGARYEHYSSIWNYTQRKVEYVPLHDLSGEHLRKYLRGAVAIPFFSKGEHVDGDLILDGAFLDNIPVHPLLDKDLDYVFCVYFDNYRYFFENDEFDKKVVKLYDFPNERMLELMTFRPLEFDGMVQYGYDYTMRTIRTLFDGAAPDDKDAIYAAIARREETMEATYKPRLTADVVLNNINVMAKRYSKLLSGRVKKKDHS